MRLSWKGRCLLKKLIALIALVSLLVLAGCAQGQVSSSTRASAESSSTVESAPVLEASASSAKTSSPAESPAAVESHTSFIIGVNGMQLMVEPADTNAARALMERLQAGPVTVSLHAYGGFEQVGPLPWSLPASDEQIAASPGDIMLYQGDQITIFTGSNSWAYTPLGSIEDVTPEMLSEVFAGDAVEITLSLA